MDELDITVRRPCWWPRRLGAQWNPHEVINQRLERARAAHHAFTSGTNIARQVSGALAIEHRAKQFGGHHAALVP
jgi:hypothetical protein